MSVLLKEIQSVSKEAASLLQQSGFDCDSEIQTLTRGDLQELFPGPNNLKLRRSIFEIIQKQVPINVLLKNLKDFIPQESFRAALTNNGVLVDYLHVLKDMKTQLNSVQTFLDAHIRLLEEMSDQQPQPQEQNEESSPASLPPVEGPMPNSAPPTAQECYPAASVPFLVVTYGHTFNAHMQLLDNLRAKEKDRLQLIETSQDYQIIIVFCVISSRIDADVDATMVHVPVDKPVILVLMHYTQAATTKTESTWPKYPNIELQVNVFFHEKMRGLLRCTQNDEAASKIGRKLLQYSTWLSRASSRNSLDVHSHSSAFVNFRTGSQKTWWKW